MAENKKNPFLIIIIILALAFYFNLGGIGDKATDFIEGKADISPTSQTEFCLHDRTTMTIGRMSDLYYPENSVIHEYAYVFINGEDRGYYVDGSSITVTPNEDKIEIYYAINSTEYYSGKAELNVPCTSAFSTSELTETEKLYKSNNEVSSNISGSWKCTHADGTTISLSNMYDFSADTAVTLSCVLEPIRYKAFSPHERPAVCFEYDLDDYDNIQIQGETKLVAPDFLSDYADDEKQISCYAIDSIYNKDDTYYKVLVETDGTYTAGNISQYLVDQDYFKNTESGKVEIGYETNKGGDVGSLQEAKNTIYGE